MECPPSLYPGNINANPPIKIHQLKPLEWIKSQPIVTGQFRLVGPSSGILIYLDQPHSIHPRGLGPSHYHSTIQKKKKAEPCQLSLVTFAEYYQQIIRVTFCRKIIGQVAIRKHPCRLPSWKVNLGSGLIIQHLVHKYSSPKGDSLFSSFINFKSAFDFNLRDNLWAKFEATSNNRHPLLIMRCLHENLICGSFVIKLALCLSQFHLSEKSNKAAF